MLWILIFGTPPLKPLQDLPTVPQHPEHGYSWMWHTAVTPGTPVQGQSRTAPGLAPSGSAAHWCHTAAPNLWGMADYTTSLSSPDLAVLSINIKQAVLLCNTVQQSDTLGQMYMIYNPKENKCIIFQPNVFLKAAFSCDFSWSVSASPFTLKNSLRKAI